MDYQSIWTPMKHVQGACGGVGRVGNGVNHHCFNVRASACMLMAVSRTERSKIDQSPTTRVSSSFLAFNYLSDLCHRLHCGVRGLMRAKLTRNQKHINHFYFPSSKL